MWSVDGYKKPDFFRGPHYSYYREQHKNNNNDKFYKDGTYDYISYNA